MIDNTATDPTQIGYVVIGLLSILQLISLAVSIWARVRRQPALDQVLSEFIRRPEIDIHFNKLYDINRDMLKELSEWQRSIERQIGRLESSYAAQASYSNYSKTRLKT